MKIVISKLLNIIIRRSWVWAIGIVLIHRLLMLMTASDLALRAGIHNTIALVLAISIAIGMFFVALHSKDTRYIQVAWSLYGVGMLLIVAGVFFAAVLDIPGQTPSPTIADGFFLAFYPAFGAGLILMAGTTTVEERLKMILDIAIVMTTAFLVFWIVLIAPILSVHASKPLTIAIFVSYPIGDGALIVAVLWVLFSRPGYIRSIPLLLLALAGTTQVVYDLFYLSETISGTYLPGNWIDTLPITTFSILIMVVGLQINFRPSKIITKIPTSNSAGRQFGWTVYIPLVAITVAYTLFYWTADDVYPLSYSLFAWIVGGIIGLAIIRQVIAFQENNQLTRQLQKELAEREATEQAIRVLNEELEERVLDRTAALTQEIAERRQVQSERERLITELKAKNVELEQFTYTVSHDLKAPLITIRGFLGLVEKDALVGNIERVRTDMARIIEATEKMQRLLTELLELSRIGRMMNPPQAVPFDEIVREAVELARGRITERSIQIEISPGLPVVYGDRMRLVQVMQNLIDNATKFMGNQLTPYIVIGRDGEEAGKPIFFIKDNGIGIAPELHGKIFSLFNKLDPNSEGTGVGLTLVKRIIEVHGGRIWVESDGKNNGTTFYFTLPTA
jgi:signal transduction histidine kinase